METFLVEEGIEEEKKLKILDIIKRMGNYLQVDHLLLVAYYLVQIVFMLTIALSCMHLVLDKA